jgi:aldehyde:ferredoxin oxidoreductase
MAWLFSAGTGVEIDGDGLLKVGERIFTVERAFNVREGMTPCPIGSLWRKLLHLVELF